MQLIFSGIGFLQQYGWFLLLGVIVCMYIKSKLSPKVEKFKRQAEDARAARNYSKYMYTPVPL